MKEFKEFLVIDEAADARRSIDNLAEFFKDVGNDIDSYLNAIDKLDAKAKKSIIKSVDNITNIIDNLDMD